ncbi:MAG: hypothetical protein FKY71_19330, partial [Spiribacter salinus]
MGRSSSTAVHPPGPLHAWITFFKHWQEEFTMATVAHEPVQQAMNRIRQLPWPRSRLPGRDDERRRVFRPPS